MKAPVMKPEDPERGPPAVVMMSNLRYCTRVQSNNYNYFPYLVSYWRVTSMDNNTRPMASFDPESPFPRDPAGRFRPTSPGSLPVAELRSVRVLDTTLSPPGVSPLIFTQRAWIIIWEQGVNSSVDRLWERS